MGAWIRGRVPGLDPERVLTPGSGTFGAARKPAPLLLYAALAGGLLAFVAIAVAVREHATQAVDLRLLLAARTPGDVTDPIGPPWLDHGVRDVTALGSAVVITTVTVVASLYFLVRRQRRAAALMAVGVAAGALLCGVLKLAFMRPQPGLVPYVIPVDSTSFPSGHSMMAVVTYFILAGLIARIHPAPRMKRLLMGSAGIVSLLVGLSRIFLATHWPTDVLGGWALGISWTAACWLVATRLEGRAAWNQGLARP
jgi:undecaprenyl-diphosphatase